ncbi:hypothetical protein KR074_004912 [Drosophila pseudoananassae]|nr:hypothetical protein KR074_004912 [Drosophila pseudoananassae]
MAQLGDKLLSGESVFVIYGSKRSLDYFPFPEMVQLIEKKQSGVLILVATREQKLKLRELICKELREKCSSNFLDGNLLIETPALLQDQLQPGPNQKPLNENSIVFHELDKLVEYNGVQFEELKQELFSALSRPQLIVTTGCWNRNLLGGLLGRSNQNLVLLKDALEAAVYSDLAMTIEWANDSAEKVQLLHSYLESFRPDQYRTLIYSANANELANKMPNIRTLEHQGRASKNGIKNWQEKTKGQVLVLEKHSPELRLDRIESLLHFDMPKTWNQFRERFGESSHFLPHLVEFQQGHGGVVSEKIAAEHVQLRQEREVSRASRQCVICPVLMLYGRCRTLTCQYRHFLGEVDKRVPSTVPKEGRIQFKVLKVGGLVPLSKFLLWNSGFFQICTPTHFASRLLALKADESTVWAKFPQEDVQDLLEKYYSKPENIKELGEPLLQDICAYKRSDGGFERVSITFLPHHSRDSDIRVKNLDSNTAIYHAKPQELVQLPEDLKNLPPLAWDIRLVGCIPFNGEEAWQSVDLQSVGELMKEGDVCEATICFSLSHTIFVEQLVVEQGSYRELLERKKLSRYDNEICNCLKKLCNK